MAVEETDREDLMREATALVERVEIRVPGWAETVIMGRKRNGDVSLYFGASPVYHLNANGQLRRAHAGEYLYRSQETALARMHRERTAEATILHREDLSSEETESFLGIMQQQLDHLRGALADSTAAIIQQIPAENFPLEDLLNSLPATSPELAPRIPGKR